MQKVEEAQPTGHPGWMCDDAHPNLTHERWAAGDYGQEPPDGLDLGGAADQAAEAAAEVAEPQDPYSSAENGMEGNEVE